MKLMNYCYYYFNELIMQHESEMQNKVIYIYY